MLPFSSTMADQIRFLLRSCNDSNFDSVFDELCEFVEYGSEGSILLLQTCLQQIDVQNCMDVQNLQVRPDLVAAVLKCLLDKPNFSTVFCEALRNDWVSDEFLEELSKVLNLSKSEKIGLGLALSDSENFKFRTIGQNFCISQIEELYVEPTAVLSHGQIQDIIMFLYRSEGLTKHVDSFTKMLSLLQQKEKFPFVLDPVLQDDTCLSDSSRHLDRFLGSSDNDFEAILSEIEKEISMSDIMKELGYDCTIDISRCTEVLSLFKPLNEATISKILGTISRTHAGLEESQNTHSAFSAILWSNSIANTPQLRSWNINILVDSIKQLAPETNWDIVIKNFDHDGFFVPEEDALTFLMSVYSAACPDPFPLGAVCGSLWKNAEGQLSFLRHAVSAPPEVFTFAHSTRKLQLVESAHYQNGHENQAWFCLDLLEVLCQLAEMGHASSVRKIFEYPLRQLPEVLLVGVAHIRTAYNLLQNEVSSTILPTIIQNTSEGSANVIGQLWHVNSSLVLLGFIDAVCADPVSIVRVLDICEELKILPQVLDLAPFSFSIKLAAVASRKELINLETWLKDNLNVYKDVFHEVCLNFLKGLLPDATLEISSDVTQDSGAASSTNQEMFQKILKVLQAHPGQNLSSQFSEEMNKISLSQFRAHCGEEDDMPVGDADDDDIEAEANAYFHQMFSGQLSIDIMVQTLSRFKESSDNREQRIFDCMIGNLFEEYKFFPKYPERQLKIAAVLFGSLIKHQLVTHLTLGIALRCVLDALRKSVDSKMFQFGAKALEQFTDRLIEWPQYCNHILQISHLRSTHADLVSFIEHALARISSSQADSNGGNNIVVEQQQASAPSFTENVEMMNSNSLQSAQQLPPPYQIQQRRLGTPDDRVKVSAPLVTHMKPNSSASGLPVLSPAPVNSDSAGNMKAIVPQSQAPVNSSSGTTAISSSPGFLRPSRSITPSGVLRQPSYSTGFGAALNIETLVAAAERRDTAIEAPASEVQDKIFFIINNISSANIDAKAKEFTDVLKEEYHPWFAQYMVMKRASIEPNFHDLYLKFLDKVNSRALNKEIVKATYENCKVLLRSDLIKSSSEERSLLKNLGSWLGKFTIGRNQALRAREIDPKVLIIEAYEKGLMIAVIPFTSKVLEPCQCSLAYQPPNPWTMAILGLLVEIYNLPHLKMNLKFDIEVLFKNLSVDLKDVKPTTLLKDRAREIEGNPDFSNKDIITASPATNSSEVNVGSQTSLNQTELHAPVTNTSHPGIHSSAALSQYSGPTHLPSNTFMDDDKMGAINISERAPPVQVQSQVNPSHTSFPMSQLLSSISSISSHVVVNSKLSGLGLQMQLQRIIPVALEKAIRDTISPVVQRSVTIASQTTKELVQKDYAMEFDENRILNAAHLMVSSLARSLAHVTCKEPLRQTMSNHLRSLFQAINVGGDVLEQAVQLVTNDNLDLGCALIEQAAAEKALQTIDGEIASFISYRRKQMENGGSAFYDAGTYAQGPFARVPEALRPKPGRLSVHQQRVYEDFVKYPLYNPSAQSPSAVPSAAGSLGPSGGPVGSVGRAYSSNSGQLSSGIHAMPPAASGFGGVSQPPDFISEEMDPASSQFTSASTHNGANDNAFQQSVEAKTVLSALAPPPELHVVEPSPTIKEFGSVTLPTPTTTVERLGMTNSESLSTGEALDKFQIVAQKLDACLSKDPKEADIQGLIAEVPDIILKCVSRDEAALAVAQKVFKRLFDNASNSMHVNTHLTMLAAVRDVCKLVVKELTSWVIYSDEERKFNKDITISFIRSDLLNLAEYDMHLAKLIDGGQNKAATEFAVSLVQALVAQEPGVNVSEFYNLIDTLTKLAMRPGSPESLQQLVEVARSNSTLNSLPNTAVSKDEKDSQFKDKKANSVRGATNLDDYTVSESLMSDPSGFRDQVSALFTEWYRISELTVTNEAACAHFILQLQQSGLLKGDDRTDHFFRVLTDLVVGHCLASEKLPPVSMSSHSCLHVSHLSFLAIDIYAKLVALVIKQIAVDHGDSNVSFIHRILVVTVKVIQKDAEEKKALFNPRPYFRIFINFLMDFISPDPLLDGINFQVLLSLANAFHALQPLKVPVFSYAWLELVSHRNFMPKLLMSSNQKGWPYFQCLLVDLFKFMEPYLRNADLGEPVQCLYRGTMRMLLVLLHDFPEFLCDYHFSFCDVIPASCVQMRNVILSAFPVNMRLPDPCTPNLKIDLLPEIEQHPRILSDVDAALRTKQLKTDIDEFLKTKALGPSYLSDLKQRLLLPPNESLMAGTRYNVPLINSIVLYVGMQAIQQLPGKSASHVPSAPRPMDIRLVGEAAMDIFNSLIQDLDTEGRYLFLNAAANQLRYPNNHTHYFSFVLLYLFVEADQDIIREQITRVLLERLIANRPHPWGLLITFIELIKNPRYNFWNRTYIRCAPEIEKLFDTVSRSIGGSRGADDGMVSGGLSDGGH